MLDDNVEFFSKLLDKSIVTPVKQKVSKLSDKIIKQEKKIRLLQIWLFIISVLILGNIILCAFLLTKVK
jgi:hypothetical protein